MPHAHCVLYGIGAKTRYLKIVTELPKTATGKVQRGVLRKLGVEGASDIGE